MSVDLTKLATFDLSHFVGQLELKMPSAGDVVIKLTRDQAKRLIKILKGA